MATQWLSTRLVLQGTAGRSGTRLRTFARLGAVVFIAACASAETAPQDASVPEAPRPGEGRMPPPAPPALPLVLRLDAQARGSFRASESFEIESVLTARHDVRSMSFTITMPELDDARRTPASLPLQRRPSGERYPALDSIGGSLDAGEVRRHVTRVTIDEPGYYLVSIVARVHDDVTRFPEPVVTETFRSFWVWVDADSDGHVASGTDATRYPIGMRRQNGPIRAADIAPIPPEPRPLSPVATELVGTVRDRAGRPIPDVRVTVRAYHDGCPGRGMAEAVARTAGDGRYRVRLDAANAPFRACIALHFDPPAGSGLAHHSVQDMTEFTATGARRQIDAILDARPAAWR